MGLPTEYDRVLQERDGTRERERERRLEAELQALEASLGRTGSLDEELAVE